MRADEALHRNGLLLMGERANVSASGRVNGCMPDRWIALAGRPADCVLSEEEVFPAVGSHRPTPSCLEPDGNDSPATRQMQRLLGCDFSTFRASQAFSCYLT